MNRRKGIRQNWTGLPALFIKAGKKDHAGINRNQLAAAVIDHLLKETQKLCIPGEYIDRSMVVGRRIRIMDNSGQRIVKAFKYAGMEG